LRQFADDGENIRLVVAGFDHHENGDGEQYPFEKVVEADKVCRHAQHGGTNHPLNHQPGGKQVQALEGVEADDPIALEAAGGQYDYGGDPAYGGNVTEDGGGTRR
jgi:hypothetical protein